VLGCSPIDLQLSPSTVPNTGSNRLELIFEAGQDGSDWTTLSVADRELLIQRRGDNAFVDVPPLEAGTHEVQLDGEESTATLTVYEAELIVEFIDVGQGDAQLVIAPDGSAYLIDCGPVGAAQAIRSRLEHHDVERLERVILTHTDADHIGGLPELLLGPDGVRDSADDLMVGAVLEDGALAQRNTQIARSVNELIDARIQRIIAQPGDRIEGPGGFKLEIVSAGGATQTSIASAEASDHANARSITATVCLDDWCGWFGGDLTGGGLSTPDVEAPLSQELRPVAFVKIPHHGSRSSSSRALVEALRPRIAVVSLGTNNDHCHPTTEVLARWAESGTVLSTGAGQTQTDRCDATVWPARSLSGCGHITMRKGSGSYASIDCNEQSLSF